jgi:putative sigma-54 modulation protein
MRFEIKGVHYDISDATREFIETKLEKIKFAESHIIDLLFTLTKNNNSWNAEANCNFRWGDSAHLEEEAYNLHEGLEKLIDRLNLKIKKEKEKITDHHKS